MTAQVYFFHQAPSDAVPLVQSTIWQQPVAASHLTQWALCLGTALHQRHQQGQLYAQWDPEHCYIDEQGNWYLLEQTPAIDSPWLAFELMAQEPSWPIGPAVDVYGLGMLLRSLLLKRLPPIASTRWLKPLSALYDMGVEGIEPRLLRAIDLATEQDPALRLASIEEFLLYLGQTLSQSVAASTVLLEEPAAVAALPVTQPAPTSSAPTPPAPIVGAVSTTWQRRTLYALFFLGAVGVGAWAYGLWQKPAPVIETPLASMDEPFHQQVAAEKEWQQPFSKTLISEDVDSIENAEIWPEQKVLTEELEVLGPTLDPVSKALALELVASPPAEPKLAAPAPASSPKPAATGATGTLRIAVLPWGDVYVNGRRQGASPPLKELKLKAGKHRLQIRNGDLTPYQATIEIEAGQSVTIRHKF